MYFQKRLWHLWAWLAYSRVFPEKIPYVLSMYGHVKHCHIGHVVSRKKSSLPSKLLEHYCHISHAVSRLFFQVVSMYARSCHIGHVFPDKDRRGFRMYELDCHIGHVFSQKRFPMF